MRLFSWVKKKLSKKKVIDSGPFVPALVLTTLPIKLEAMYHDGLTTEEREFFLKSMNYFVQALNSPLLEEKVSPLFPTIKITPGNKFAFRFNLYSGGAPTTIGYSNGDGITVFTNRISYNRWMLGKDYVSFCGHVFHEHLHHLGLRHGFRQRGDVIYQGGYRFSDIVKSLL